MIGVVVNKDGKVSEHVRDADRVEIINESGTIDDRVSLKGIDKAWFPGWKVYSSVIGKVNKLYTGIKPQLSWLYRLSGISNDTAKPGTSSYSVAKLAYST